MLVKRIWIVPMLVLLLAIAGCPNGDSAGEASGENGGAVKELAVQLASGDGKAIASTVTYEVLVNGGPSDIHAFGLDVGFDPNQLSYIDWEKGDLTAGFTQIGANAIAGNRVRVGGFTVDEPVLAGSNGALIALHFEVLAQAPDSLPVSNAVDDVQAYTAN